MYFTVLQAGSLGRAALERSIRRQWEAGDHAACITLALEGYGPELLGFLVAVLRDPDQAREAFAEACADMWQGLTGFRWDCSFRTWAYTITRHAAERFRSEEMRRGRRVDHDASISNIVKTVTTVMAPYLRTAVKDQVAQLRSMLTTEEQTILVLRIDRKLPWNDIARVLLPPEPPASEADIRREAANCRKRFERATSRLRELAREAGILAAQ